MQWKPIKMRKRDRPEKKFVDDVEEDMAGMELRGCITKATELDKWQKVMKMELLPKLRM